MRFFVLVCLLTGCGWSPNETFGDFDTPDVLIPQKGNGVEGGSAVGGGLAVGRWPTTVDATKPARFATRWVIEDFPATPETGPTYAPPQPPQRIAHGRATEKDFFAKVWLDSPPIDSWEELVIGGSTVYMWQPWNADVIGGDAYYEVDGALPPSDARDLNASAISLVAGGRYVVAPERTVDGHGKLSLWCPGHPALAFPCVPWADAVGNREFFRCFNLRNKPREVSCRGYVPAVGISATYHAGAAAEFGE